MEINEKIRNLGRDLGYFIDKSPTRKSDALICR